jgi:hypothetical protein
MGRREKPISQCGRTLYSLAAWLRAGREAAGLTYDELAARTEFSADTLARAVSGRSVPKNLNVVLAYAQACGLPTREAEKYWKLARRDEARALGVLSGRRGGMQISVVKDFADLHSAIVELYQSAGSPPLRSLDARIGGLGRLPRSTVGRVLKGQSRPSRPFVQDFAEALCVRRSELPEWGKAWDRADRDRRSTRSRLRDQGQSRLLDRLTTHDRVTPRDLQLLMSELETSARREPGIKLLVHIPEAEDAEGYKAARMTRELLVDQAQRRGDLSCPSCRRPSFGYDDAQGWRASLCSDCSGLTPGTLPASRLQPETAAQDTPTLSLRSPAANVRPRLPRRIPGHSWPRAAAPASSQPQVADNLKTISDIPQPKAPAQEVRCRTCHGYHEADDPHDPHDSHLSAPDAAGDDAPNSAPPDSAQRNSDAKTSIDPARFKADPAGSPADTARSPADTDTDTDTAEGRPSTSQRALGDFFAVSRSHHPGTASDSGRTRTGSSRQRTR